MDIRSLQIALGKKERPDFYFVHGEDEFLKDEIETSLREALSEKNEGDIEVYYADQMNYEKCLDSLHTLPFLSPSKLVVIKAAEKLKVSFLEDVEKLLSSGPLEGLSLVLFFSKVDKRKKVIKALLKRGFEVDAKPPYESQVGQWIQYIAKKEKVKIDFPTSNLISFLVGPSLMEISKSIAKVKDSFDVEQINRTHVQEVLSKTKVDDVFKICDLIGLGDLTSANLQIEASLKNAANPIGMLSLFFRHFKILEDLQKIKRDSGAARMSQKDISAKVGVPPYFLKNYQSQSSAWPLSKLTSVFHCLEAADLSLKSTRLSPKTVFAGLIVEISRIYGEKKGLRTLSESL